MDAGLSDEVRKHSPLDPMTNLRPFTPPLVAGDECPGPWPLGFPGYGTIGIIEHRGDHPAASCLAVVLLLDQGLGIALRRSFDVHVFRPGPIDMRRDALDPA